MSIELLTPGDLDHIFEDLRIVSKRQGFKLLPERPSDLLQIETSYVYDGSDFILLLHVPMIPEDALLRLLRLRPFPIPFSREHSLLPKPPSSLLALSKGKNRLMTTIEHSDLVGCHQIGNVYVCDRHGVLRKNIKSNCLGALFEQDIEEARKLCDMEIVPRTEAVLQLEGNWFLIYSPVMFTGHVLCENGSSSEVYIKREVRKVHVDPGCSLDLKDHQLNSEFSLYLDSNVRYIDWEREDLSLFGLNEGDVKETLDESGLKNGGIFLTDVIKHQRSKSRFSFSNFVQIFVGALSVLGIIVLLSLSLGAQRLVYIRTRIRTLKQNFLSSISTLADQINRVLHHLSLPQLLLNRLYPNLPVAAENQQPIAPPPPFPAPDQD